MLQDRLISNSEEILQVNLQRAFGLSYDQYVSLVRPIIKPHIKELEERISNSQSAIDKGQIEVCIRNLRSVFLIR